MKFCFVSLLLLSTVLHQLHCLLQDSVGRGVSYVVYWKCSEEFGSELFRVCLTIYQEDLLQVRGLSYMLWMLDCYPALANMVTMMQLHQQVRSPETHNLTLEHTGFTF